MKIGQAMGVGRCQHKSKKLLQYISWNKDRAFDIYCNQRIGSERGAYRQNASRKGISYDLTLASS